MGLLTLPPAKGRGAPSRQGGASGPLHMLFLPPVMPVPLCSIQERLGHLQHHFPWEAVPSPFRLSRLLPLRPPTTLHIHSIKDFVTRGFLVLVT